MSIDVHTRRRRSATLHGGLLTACLVLGACSSGSDGVSVPIPDPSPIEVDTPSAASDPPATDATTPPTVPTTTELPATTTTTTTTTGPPTSTVPATVAPTTTAPIVYYSEGDEGPEIEIMQLKLITVGYLDEGLATGVFGPATARALRNFQGQYGLGVDGVFGPLTDRALTAAANSVNVDGG